MATKRTRRDFMRLSALGAASALVAACAQPEVVEKVVKETVVVEGTPQVVEKVIKETVVVEKEVQAPAPASGKVIFDWWWQWGGLTGLNAMKAVADAFNAQSQDSF